MDLQRLLDMMNLTLTDPKVAEEQLNQVCKIIGFAPSLLQIIVRSDVQMPVRQATVVYLKNFISENWLEKDESSSTQLEFSVHEQDRDAIRNRIVEDLIQAPELIQVQLATCVYHILKADFPGRWPQIVNKIQAILMQSRAFESCTGAILCLYQLVKNYEYKKADDRAPLDEAMNILLPLMYQLMVELMDANTEQTHNVVLLQKNILKIYYTLIQFCLPLDLITNDIFTKWMVICRGIIDRPVSVDVSQLAEEERLELPWWKAKKWALHICVRTFERYGSPTNCVNKEYKEFAKWYLPTFTGGIIETLLKVLESHRNKVYVSSRVLTETLNYLKTAAMHAYTWKILKPHTMTIVREIIFPIMQFDEEDQELYEDDPIEYIRRKFDIYDDFSTPVPAAELLFSTCCKSRKGILQESMNFLNQIITAPDQTPRARDGALYMIGSVSDILIKSKQYRDHLEQLMITFVLPEFSNELGHMRARACWVLQRFSDVKFKDDNVLLKILERATEALLTDPDLAVKVNAAITLKQYLLDQEKTKQFLEPRIQPIVMQLLKITDDTEIDDLSLVMQEMVHTFSEQLLPIAVDICQHLEAMFTKLLGDENMAEEKDDTAMSYLNTIGTLVSVFEENPTVAANVEPFVIKVVRLILQQNAIYFYDEAFSLIYDLTSKTISPDMWSMLELIYDVFQKDAFDCFIDLMPALHNYITVDTEAFLSNPAYLGCMFEMCKSVLSRGEEAGIQAECHAAKLLEVIILQCRGHIDGVVPSFVEMAVHRLMQDIKSSELRTMCLQVLIAALYYNPALLLTLMKDHQFNNELIVTHFVKQWINDTDCFLGIHDRKLYVLGICTILSLGENKPFVMNEIADKVLPALLMVFEGLEHAYKLRAQEEEEEEDEEEGDDDDCEDALSSDEDDVEEFNSSYLDSIKNFATKKSAQQGLDMSAEIKDDDEDSDDDDDGSEWDEDETLLESFETLIDVKNEENPIDEYLIFQQVMQVVSTQDPQYYGHLVEKLSQEQSKGLNDVMVLADKKRAQYASSAIERQGGYAFAAPSGPPPKNFNFGA